MAVVRERDTWKEKYEREVRPLAAARSGCSLRECGLRKCSLRECGLRNAGRASAMRSAD